MITLAQKSRRVGRVSETFLRVSWWGSLVGGRGCKRRRRGWTEAMVIG